MVVREGTSAGEATASFLAKEEDARAIGIWSSAVVCVSVSCAAIHLLSVLLVYTADNPEDEGGEEGASGEVLIDLVAGISDLFTLVWLAMVIVFTQRFKKVVDASETRKIHLLWILKILLSLVEWMTGDHPLTGKGMTAGVAFHMFCGALLTPLCFGLVALIVFGVK